MPPKVKPNQKPTAQDFLNKQNINGESTAPESRALFAVNKQKLKPAIKENRDKLISILKISCGDNLQDLRTLQPTGLQSIRKKLQQGISCEQKLDLEAMPVSDNAGKHIGNIVIIRYPADFACAFLLTLEGNSLEFLPDEVMLSVVNSKSGMPAGGLRSIKNFFSTLCCRSEIPVQNDANSNQRGILQYSSHYSVHNINDYGVRDDSNQKAPKILNQFVENKNPPQDNLKQSIVKKESINLRDPDGEKKIATMFNNEDASFVARKAKDICCEPAQATHGAKAYYTFDKYSSDPSSELKNAIAGFSSEISTPPEKFKIDLCEHLNCKFNMVEIELVENVKQITDNTKIKIKINADSFSVYVVQKEEKSLSINTDSIQQLNIDKSMTKKLRYSPSETVNLVGVGQRRSTNEDVKIDLSINNKKILEVLETLKIIIYSNNNKQFQQYSVVFKQLYAASKSRELYKSIYALNSDLIDRLISDAELCSAYTKYSKKSAIYYIGHGLEGVVRSAKGISDTEKAYVKKELFPARKIKYDDAKTGYVKLLDQATKGNVLSNLNLLIPHKADNDGLLRTLVGTKLTDVPRVFITKTAIADFLASSYKIEQAGISLIDRSPSNLIYTGSKIMHLDCEYNYIDQNPWDKDVLWYPCRHLYTPIGYPKSIAAKNSENDNGLKKMRKAFLARNSGNEKQVNRMCYYYSVILSVMELSGVNLREISNSDDLNGYLYMFKSDFQERVKSFLVNLIENNIEKAGDFLNQLGDLSNIYETDSTQSIYATGMRYDGELNEIRVPNGQGKLYDAYGKRKYEGGWIDGKENGQGKFYDANGKLRYEGVLVDGKQNRQGKFYDANGNLLLN